MMSPGLHEGVLLVSHFRACAALRQCRLSHARKEQRNEHMQVSALRTGTKLKLNLCSSKANHTLSYHAYHLKESSVRAMLAPVRSREVMLWNPACLAPVLWWLELILGPVGVRGERSSPMSSDRQAEALREEVRVHQRLRGLHEALAS